MTFEEGNTYNFKLEDPEVFKDAYIAYCAWMKKGKSKKSFVFEDKRIPRGYAGYESIEATLKRKEGVYDPIHMEMAKRQGYAIWEEKVENSATGADKGKSNTASLQMVMRNKYKWDTKEHLYIMDTENELTPTDKAIDGTTKSLTDRPEPL